MNENGSKLCGCGCGQRISANKELKFGHEMPIPEPVEAEPVKKTRKPRAKKEAGETKVKRTVVGRKKVTVPVVV